MGFAPLIEAVTAEARGLRPRLSILSNAEPMRLLHTLRTRAGLVDHCRGCSRKSFLHLDSGHRHARRDNEFAAFDHCVAQCQVERFRRER
jgi:hypothetical protein